MKKRKIAAVAAGVMSAAISAGTLSVPVAAADTDFYVLMNIPYNDFYAAETAWDTQVDAVTSATLNKPRTATLAGGSYHVNADGSSIDGVIYPVKVSDISSLSGKKQVTDADSVSITVTNRGQESTTEYTGKDALFENESYAYYILDEVPSYYKELTVGADGTFTFGKAQGDPTAVPGVSGTVNMNARHQDIEIVLSGTDGIAQGDKVSAVIATTNDGMEYPLKHIENLWRAVEIGFSRDSGIVGKTITNIKYITDHSIIDYPVNLIVDDFPISARAEDKNTVSVFDLPEGIENVLVTVSFTEGEGREAVTTNVAENVQIEDGKVTTTTPLEEGRTYNVTVNNTTHPILTTSFVYKEPKFVLMNIPYNDFYAGDTKADIQVDAVTSATLNKPRTGTLAGGSYHVNADGSSIDGVIFPVKVYDTEQLAGKKQVTDADSVSITVTNKGQESTTEYTGKEALFENESYAYYELSEVPSVYKELNVGEDGTFTFSDTKGEVTSVAGATGSADMSAKHKDIEIVLSGTEGIEKGDKVSAVIVTTDDGTEYPLKHIENLWRAVEIGFSRDSGIVGKTITNVRYITDEKVIDYPVSILVKDFEISADAKDDNTVIINDLPEGIENAKATVSFTEGEGREAVTTNIAEDAEIVEGEVSLDTELEEGREYNVKVTSSTHPILKTSFTAPVVAPVTPLPATPDEGGEQVPPEPKEYAITAGDKAVWTKGSDKILAFVTDGKVADFLILLVDGKEVPLEDKSSDENDNAIISLVSEYLETLEPGEHEIIVKFRDGDAKGSFTIEEAKEDEKKNDTSQTGKANVNTPSKTGTLTSASEGNAGSKAAASSAGVVTPVSGTKAPETGDKNHTALWGSAAVVAGVTIPAVIIRRKRKTEDR